MGVKEVI